jgi:hypothetical protein
LNQIEEAFEAAASRPGCLYESSGDVFRLSQAHILLCHGTSMQQNYSIANHLAGIIHVDQTTGALSWEQKNLDPVIQRYVKRYLFDEGFIEQALGTLDPALDQEFTEFLECLGDFGP